MTIRSGRQGENKKAIDSAWDRIFQKRSDALDAVSVPKPEERGGLKVAPERPGEPEVGSPPVPSRQHRVAGYDGFGSIGHFPGDNTWDAKGG